MSSGQRYTRPLGRSDLRKGRGEDNVQPSTRPLEGAMSQNFSMFLRSQNDDLHPLRRMADRVGQEVEKFAEALDKWGTQCKASLPEEGSQEVKDTFMHRLHEGTFVLINDLQSHADQIVQTLKRQHASSQRRAVGRDWRQRVKDFNGAASQMSSFAGDDESEVDFGDGSQTTLEDLRHWQSEAATWELLRLILSIDHLPPGIDKESMVKQFLQSTGECHKYSSGEDIWDSFLVEDEYAYERELVVKWLEATARDTEGDIDSVVEQLEAGAGKGKTKGIWSQGWLHTREKIKAEKRMRLWEHPVDPGYLIVEGPDRKYLATQLDPDAPTRQGHSLDGSDEYIEQSLWAACWEMLRRGIPWADIQEWCRDRNEHWRSVSIGTCSEPSFAAPNNGALWRRMCFVAAQGGLTKYERAVYGFLSGDLQTVEPVCRTWNDHLLAHYNSLMLNHFDLHLQSKYPDRLPPAMATKFPTFGAIHYHGGIEDASRRVIEMLSENEATSKEAGEPMKLIQGSIIARQFPSLVYKVGLALAQKANSETSSSMLIPRLKGPDADVVLEECYMNLADDYNALRIVAHMFLIYSAFDGGRQFGIKHHGENGGEEEEDDDPEDARIIPENVLVSYVDFLRLAGKVDLLPLYCNSLSRLRGEQTLGKCLVDITNFSEQRQQIQLMVRYGFSVTAVLKALYKAALCGSTIRLSDPCIPKLEMLEAATGKYWPGHRIRKGFYGQPVRFEDERLIRAVNWWMIVPGQLRNTFIFMSDLLEVFLENGRVAAAIKFVKEIPIRDVVRQKTMQEFGHAIDLFDESDPEFEIVNLRRSTRAGLRRHSGSARQSFSQVEEDLKMAVADLKQRGRSTYELQQLLLALETLHDWRTEEDDFMAAKMQPGSPPPNKGHIKDLFDTVRTVMEPVFHEFLTHGDDELEVKTLTGIRRAYLPELILAYICVIVSSAWLHNRDSVTLSMDVATAIASEEGKDLEECFIATKRMSELVDMLAMTGLVMLQLTSPDGAKASVKGKNKRGWGGETLKIWDFNMKC